MENIIKFEQSKIWIENEILFCQFNNKNSNYKLNTDNVNSIIEAITKLCKGKAMPFIIDVRNTRGTFSTSAAVLLAQSPALVKLRISEAFILNNIGIKLLIASYKRIYEPITPFAIFSTMDTAKDYCIESKKNYYESN